MAAMWTDLLAPLFDNLGASSREARLRSDRRLLLDRGEPVRLPCCLRHPRITGGNWAYGLVSINSGPPTWARGGVDRQYSILEASLSIRDLRKPTRREVWGTVSSEFQVATLSNPTSRFDLAAHPDEISFVLSALNVLSAG